jgi:hypothetical protein
MERVIPRVCELCTVEVVVSDRGPFTGFICLLLGASNIFPGNECFDEQ